jgi:hypothetical protein
VIDYDEYVDFLIRESKHYPTGAEVQVIKLMEEVGEVAAAWIGVQGTNPRKGVTHRESEVVAELADVINTAMLMIVKLGFDPFGAMLLQKSKVEGYMTDASA